MIDPAIRVFIILGIRHPKLPTSLFLYAQDRPEQLRIIQTQVEGRNALDLVLTLELGRIVALDPEGYFHIVSKDTDFDSIVRHLKGTKKRIARYASLPEIPALWTVSERLAFIVAELADTSKSRPGTRTTLENKIQHAFHNKAEPEFVEKAIKAFVHAGILEFSETDRVIYKAA